MENRKHCIFVRVRPIKPYQYRYQYSHTDIQQTDTDTDTCFQNLYQTDTDTNIWFGIQIKPIPIIGINRYHTDICIPIQRNIGMNIKTWYRFIPIIGIGIGLIWIPNQISVSVWYKFLKHVSVSVSVCCISVWLYRYRTLISYHPFSYFTNLYLYLYLLKWYRLTGP